MQITDAQALGLMAAVTAPLAAAVRQLYARQNQLYDRLSASAAKCEEDRGEMANKIEKLEERMDACPVRDCPIRPPRLWLPAQTVTANNKTENQL